MVPRILIFAKIIHWNVKLLPHTKRETTPECVCWHHAILLHSSAFDFGTPSDMTHIPHIGFRILRSECKETHRHFQFVPAQINKIFLWSVDSGKSAGETLREHCEHWSPNSREWHKNNKMRMVDLRDLVRISVWPITWAHYPDSCRFFHFSSQFAFIPWSANTDFIDSSFLVNLPLLHRFAYSRCSASQKVRANTIPHFGRNSVQYQGNPNEHTATRALAYLLCAPKACFEAITI